MKDAYFTCQRAEKLIGSYNLSLVSFLIERMSKGRGKKKEKHFHSTHFQFLISFFSKSSITSIDIFIISVGYLICYTLSVSRGKKNLLKDSKQFNELAIYSVGLQGVRSSFVQEEPGT